MPVPSISILKFLKISSNSSGWPSSNVDILILYVSDVAEVVFFRIFTLMMCVARSSSNSKFMSSIGGVLMCYCTSALIYLPFFMDWCLVIDKRISVTSHIVNLQISVHIR